MTIDKSALKSLAEAATPGPWTAVDYRSYSGDAAHWYLDTSFRAADVFDEQDGTISPNHWDDERGERDMKFIAAANPAAVLELIAEIDSLKLSLVDLGKQNAWLGKYNTQRHVELSAENVRVIRKRLDAEQECDQLKAENEALRKDAERYRWLRQDDVEQYQISTKCSEEKMDASIDAAMSKGEQL